MSIYTARVVYPLENSTMGSVRQSGFDTVASATEWLSEKLTWFLMNWAEINPDGITVVAEVYNQIENFSDMYELKCGL